MYIPNDFKILWRQCTYWHILAHSDNINNDVHMLEQGSVLVERVESMIYITFCCPHVIETGGQILRVGFYGNKLEKKHMKIQAYVKRECVEKSMSQMKPFSACFCNLLVKPKKDRIFVKTKHPKRLTNGPEIYRVDSIAVVVFRKINK